MSISQIRTEIKELHKSFLSQYQPICKIFILGVKDSPTLEEIEAYSLSHPGTHVLKLTRQSCGEF